ncbi:MAG TPA: alpha/beta fold hydrolase [Solirubrobacteraceae bacterium]
MPASTRSRFSPAYEGLAGSWLEGWAAGATGMTKLLTASLRAGPRMLDVGRWAQLTSERGRPSWSTPHEIVFETPIARLRDFTVGSPRGLVPTLVLPPQAGHDSCIVDYSPEQSQMGMIVEAGLKRALTLDWVGATPASADSSVEDYLAVIDRAVDHCGGRVNLIGYCQGGWLATIYAALSPHKVNTLTIAGAPIDFHAGEPIIHEVLRWLAPHGDLTFYKALVASGGGVLKGEHMLGGFVLIQPGTELSRQLDLLCNLEDSQQVARYSEFEDWFKHTQDIPGGFYLWIVEHLFRDNALISGELEIGGRQVDLGQLTMPLHLLAGATDHITPPDQVFALADYASTPATKVRRAVSAGGHLGLFMGHEALAEHWPPLMAEVLSHSRPARKPAVKRTNKTAVKRTDKTAVKRS